MVKLTKTNLTSSCKAVEQMLQTNILTELFPVAGAEKMKLHYRFSNNNNEVKIHTLDFENRIVGVTDGLLEIIGCSLLITEKDDQDNPYPLTHVLYRSDSIDDDDVDSINNKSLFNDLPRAFNKVDLRGIAPSAVENAPYSGRIAGNLMHEVSATAHQSYYCHDKFGCIPPPNGTAATPNCMGAGGCLALAAKSPLPIVMRMLPAS